jgi:uncharacterized membrane protein YraQ (UPF0718 family)/YHS domain-containing protein
MIPPGGIIDAMGVLWHGIRDTLLMAWQIWWALAFGFFVSAVVQAWVPRERIQSALSGSGARPVSLATVLGAASSSCSYAAAAIAKSLLQRGASAAVTLAFQFASTNLVWELGFVLWVLIGWRFSAAEFVGGLVMVAVAAVGVRRLIPAELETEAREHAIAADSGHVHHTAGAATYGGLWGRLTSAEAWSDVAHNFRGDWQMLWKEISIGVVLAGFVAQVPNRTFHGLFLHGSSSFVQALWGAVIGPLLAIATFVCSVGNVSLAAVLWSGGLSFAGVIAFLFSDILILPLISIYRRYYGGRFAARYVSVMVIAIVLAALIVNGLFSLLGLSPGGLRPLRADVFQGVRVDYKLVLNVLGATLFIGLFALTVRRGATDPVCGMVVDRAKSVKHRHGVRTLHFCGEGCRDTFVANPEAYLGEPAASGGVAPEGA